MSVNENESEIVVRTKLPREEIITRLFARDGDICAYPGCSEVLDREATGKLEVTIDHHYPQSWCFDNGWTYEQVWALDNLRLMTKKCNAKKGHLVPNEDGSLPDRNRKEFRYRRHKRANRPEVCNPCQSGRNLGPDEICAACGSGPMPERFPRWAKAKANECDHELFWCWVCSIGIIERPAATTMILTREGGDE